MSETRSWRVTLGTLLLCGITYPAAAVLPDERIDILYHSYEGGGVKIDGPAILVRKNVGNSVSLSGKYYVDTVSGASLDVRAAGVDVDSGASPYREERTEYNLGLDYLRDRTLISVGYANSQENDYDAETFSLNVSQTFFGDLTTVSMGVSYGRDVVGRNDRPDFEEELERRRYSLTLTQILTTSLVTEFSYEAALDQGYINNPYRFIRYRDLGSERGYSFQTEVYPNTRNSDAFGLRALYHLPWRGALRAEYRYFEDNWDITAENVELRYTHSLRDAWLLEFKVRHYEQTGARFYQDLFDFRDAQNFMARDKEMGPFDSLTYGLGATYELPRGLIPGFERSTVNFYWDRIDFNYHDFRDVTVSPQDYALGEEPLYGSAANVIRFYFSFWF
ncbi:DUF3570 domain-containing protein [Marinimicrobium sp. ABcell2]|uniref:DUF3570 domain-containing protein n=1 Tax=Marinimicrobium sp. ABcell2 TaxID=3069751 RepID=UPI0027B806DE|nr:DUF3570 domain-containing protein [Marinimicrobium sp. ABcell2]MDQ2076634.1 DUF3570 domain-containing protein [Marinimicrobium sp. ABcell2]